MHTHTRPTALAYMPSTQKAGGSLNRTLKPRIFHRRKYITTQGIFHCKGEIYNGESGQLHSKHLITNSKQITFNYNIKCNSSPSSSKQEQN